MRIAPLLAVAALVAAPLLAADPAPSDPATGEPSADPTLATEDAKTIYAIGLTLWRNLSSLDLSAEEIELIERALADSAAGKPAVELNEYGPKIQALARERATRRAEKEKGLGAEYLAKAAAEPGAVRTESGMVYRELVAGVGDSPIGDQAVKVHYRGTLVDGTEFDSSYGRGEPAEFPLSRVIKCWSEGMQRMKPGGRAILVCPSELAYGDRGRPGIPGGATLVFDVELLEIVAQPAMPDDHP